MARPSDGADGQRREHTRTTAARSRTAHGQIGGADSDFAAEVGHHALERDGAEIVARTVAQAHRAGGALAFADDEHVGHLAYLRVTDAIAELLVAVVQLRAQPGATQPLPHRARIVGVLLAD